MATFTVTTAADVVDAGDGVLSLREAVAQANATTAADTILFAPAVEGQTLVLTGGELVLNQATIIDGDQNNDGTRITIDGNQNGRVITVVTNSGAEVAAYDLTVTGGYTSDLSGAGIYVGDSSRMTINRCTIQGNSTYAGNGAGIYVGYFGRLTVTESIIADNDTGQYGNGAGIGTGNQSTLAIRNSRVEGNSSDGGSGGLYVQNGSTLTLENSRIENNSGGIGFDFQGPGGLMIAGASATITNTSIIDNEGGYGGGVAIRSGTRFSAGQVTITNSTIAGNEAGGYVYTGDGGGIWMYGGRLVIRHTTITSNSANRGSDYQDDPSGGGIALLGTSRVDLFNSIVAGNSIGSAGASQGPDIAGLISFSNGHNIFSSDVAGSAPGDLENASSASIFASVDPLTGGGVLASTGIVPLRNSSSNPALSGADLLAAVSTGQLGSTGRPLPGGSLPDIGSVELNQPLPTTASARNDVLTGTSGANTLSGQAGADFLKGLAGADTLNGGDGGDVLDGGTGNDRLNGDAGIDIALFGGSTAVTVDLSLATDRATRGTEVDTLTGIEGAIGSSASDTFRGDGLANYFRGGAGRDTYTGGGDRDLFDFDSVADSPAGTGRDIITDFGHLTDVIDLAGVDANADVAGDQAFRFDRSGSLGNEPGQLTFMQSGGNTIIMGNIDTDSAAEFEIQLTGLKRLSAVDFYL